MTKIANPKLGERIRSASATIAAGVRLGQPGLELEGRRQSAIAHMENQILIGRDMLTERERRSMAALLIDIDDDEDYTADAVETNAEALAQTQSVNLRIDGDEDLEPDEID